MNEEEILKKYKLTKEEHDEYYQTIKRIYVGGKTPEKNPISIIVGGQTGAGKSGILGYSTKMFNKDNVIIINSDELSHFILKVKKLLNYIQIYILKLQTKKVTHGQVDCLKN